MMTKAIFLAGLFLAMPVQTQADPETCAARGCPVAVRFASVSDSRSYGLLIAAPDTGCRHVRFRIENDRARFLGHTPALAPGELAVVRMGRGFPKGENQVTVESVGCNVRPAATRRVVLAKVGPDHGWRAEGR